MTPWLPAPWRKPKSAPVALPTVDPSREVARENLSVWLATVDPAVLAECLVPLNQSEAVARQMADQILDILADKGQGFA